MMLKSSRFAELPWVDPRQVGQSHFAPINQKGLAEFRANRRGFS